MGYLGNFKIAQGPTIGSGGSETSAVEDLAARDAALTVPLAGPSVGEGGGATYVVEIRASDAVREAIDAELQSASRDPLIIDVEMLPGQTVHMHSFLPEQSVPSRDVYLRLIDPR